jgi:hypothetical protein
MTSNVAGLVKGKASVSYIGRFKGYKENSSNGKRRKKSGREINWPLKGKE